MKLEDHFLPVDEWIFFHICLHLAAKANAVAYGLHMRWVHGGLDGPVRGWDLPGSIPFIGAFQLQVYPGPVRWSNLD